MLNNIKATVRSFSFRIGLLIFITLCLILTTLRIQFYRESTQILTEDIRAIIEAHEEDIEQAIRNQDASDDLEIISSILDKSHDSHIYLELQELNKKSGNLPALPPVSVIKSGWSQLSLARDNDQDNLELLLKTIVHPDGTVLYIAYDMERVTLLQDKLYQVLLNNLLLSFAASLLLSTGIVWLINLKLRKVNLTAETIMKGNLADRVPVLLSNDQFDKLGLTINRMLDWISKLLDTARYASNALAHDMRTPLSRHRIELRLISERENVPEQIRQEIELAVARVDKLADMFSNITNIAKAESGAGAELFFVFDIAAAVLDAVDLYAYEFEQNGQRLKTHIEQQPIKILGDKQLISQAITNLLDNASKYTPAGALITLIVAFSQLENKSLVSISVADNGPGIPEDLREKVVQRFFRIEQSRHSEGTGLGLSLVAAVASLHQGRFSLEDNGPGLRAVLVLPALKQGT